MPNVSRLLLLCLALSVSACTNEGGDGQSDAGEPDAADVAPELAAIYGYWRVRFDASDCGGSAVREEWISIELVDGQPAVSQWRSTIDDYSITLLSEQSATISVYATTPNETVVWSIDGLTVGISWTSQVGAGDCTVADGDATVLARGGTL